MLVCVSLTVSVSLKHTPLVGHFKITRALLVYTSSSIHPADLEQGRQQSGRTELNSCVPLGPSARSSAQQIGSEPPWSLVPYGW